MDPFIGEIRQFAFGFIPHGWAACDGALLQISQNSALYALIGNVYGGDGKTTFAVPDLRGRAPMDVGVGTDGYRANPASNDGTESVTITAQQVPAHGHTVRASSALGRTATPSGTVWAIAKINPATNAYGAVGDTTMGAGALANAGGGQGHGNMQPYLVTNFCIATQGIFPSQP